MGTARPIGSTDVCVRCGAEYVVNSARHRYCKSCAAEAVAETVRAQKRTYGAAHRDSDARKESRKTETVCIICGATFRATNAAVTCSPACAAKLKKLRQDEADIRRGRRKFPAGVAYDSGLPKSGIVGVTARRNRKWTARYKGKYLGVFETIQAAAEAIEKYKSGGN